MSEGMKTAPSAAVYTLQQVAQTYGPRTVLDVGRLEIQRGEILALVGPSGAGKSTLLRLLAFLERPSRGTLQYEGRPVGEQWPDLAARREVTMVFQRPQLLRRSVADNVAYGLRLRGKKDAAGKVTAVLEQLGLAELAEASARTLSDGEMQRVALARALLLAPKVLLLDEPTANLDPYNVRLIEAIVLRANREAGVTAVMVTHNIFQARRLASRVGLLLGGELVELAETEAFFERPQRPETAAFVRGEMIY